MLSVYGEFQQVLPIIILRVLFFFLIAVMVGDRMDTDVISGMESGMSTVLVLSGVSTKETLKTYAYRPRVILNGVGDIVSLARSMEK